jgi:polar amino acid transport system substrate-binding protein
MSCVRRAILTILFFLFTLSASFGASSQLNIDMGGDYAYPPYEFLNSEGKASGFNVDLMKAIATELHAGFHVQLGLWTERVRALRSNSINVLPMFYTKDRDVNFDFSIPFAIVNHTLFIRKKAPKINSLAELSGRTVLVENGSFAHEYLSKNVRGAHLIPVSSESEALTVLSRGPYDVAIVGQEVGNALKEKLHLNNITSSGPPVLPIKYCFAVREGNKDLLDQLNDGIVKVQNNGQYDELYVKWFVNRGVPWSARTAQVVLWTTLAFILALLGVTAWNRMLRNQVQLKTLELSKALGERDQFISIASHELRTPLTPLRLQFQLVEQALSKIKKGDQSAVDQLFKYSHGMDTQLERFTRLVNNVMDMATIRSGQLLWLKREKTYAGDLLRSIVDRFRPQFESKKTPLELDIDANPLCSWDTLRIEQMVTNLLTNALKYAAGKPVRISVFTSGEQVIITVQDHGPGITPEKAAKIFEPFERGEKISASGLGLGLYIAKQIARSHNGTIRVRSELGSGTSFIVELPTHAKQEESSSRSRTAS